VEEHQAANERQHKNEQDPEGLRAGGEVVAAKDVHHSVEDQNYSENQQARCGVEAKTSGSG
jgi:hypothetical protein